MLQALDALVHAADSSSRLCMSNPALKRREVERWTEVFHFESTEHSTDRTNLYRIAKRRSRPVHLK